MAVFPAAKLPTTSTQADIAGNAGCRGRVPANGCSSRRPQRSSSVQPSSAVTRAGRVRDEAISPKENRATSPGGGCHVIAAVVRATYRYIEPTTYERIEGSAVVWCVV